MTADAANVQQATSLDTSHLNRVYFLYFGVLQCPDTASVEPLQKPTPCEGSPLLVVMAILHNAISAFQVFLRCDSVPAFLVQSYAAWSFCSFHAY